MKGLSGSALKVIACVAMLIDHIGLYLLPGYAWAHQVLLTVSGHSFTWITVFRIIGRIAFPIFAYLVVEGFKYTRDRRRYALNFLVFAILTELPWNLLKNGTLLFPGSQNVLWTLMAGFIAMCALERLQGRPWAQLLAIVGLEAALFAGHTDYCVSGLPFMMILYALNCRPALGKAERLTVEALAAAAMLPMKPFASMAFAPLSLYNGQRGFVRGKVLKYAFYAFYPLHLFIIWLLR